MGVVVIIELFFGQCMCIVGVFGNVVVGYFDMYVVGVSIFCMVNCEEGFYFFQNLVEWVGFVIVGGNCVVVYWIVGLYYCFVFLFYCLDKLWQMIKDFV